MKRKFTWNATKGPISWRCEWNNQDIIVLKSVVISKPYKPESVSLMKGASENQAGASVERVKKAAARVVWTWHGFLWCEGLGVEYLLGCFVSL